MVKMTQEPDDFEGKWPQWPSEENAMTAKWKMVPMEPTDEQSGTLARDIVMWMFMTPPTGAWLYRHLRALGHPIPAWLPHMIPEIDVVPPKGAVAAAIYRAMLDAAPAAPHDTMTAAECRAFQQWAGLDGAVAWNLISRHAEGWNETGRMMNAWLDANKAAPAAWEPADEQAKRAAYQRGIEDGKLLEAALQRHAAAPPRNREADRARYTDPAFNEWLDDSAADGGATVWDLVSDVHSAWAAWSAHLNYTAPAAPQERYRKSDIERRAPARREEMAAFAAELKANPAKAQAFFQEAGILNERGGLTPQYGGPAPDAPQQAEPCDVCNALIVQRNATHYDADDLKAAQVRGKIIAAKLQGQAEPVATVPRVWREALRKLTFMARTSGGTPGPDEGLQTACAEAETLLSKPYNYPPAAPQQAEPVTVLPDGSAFFTASMPLPDDHWIFAPRGEWDNDRDCCAEIPLPILTHAQRDAVTAAVRYAVRGATDCGAAMDFDPDALVQNAVYALCGPFSKPKPEQHPPAAEVQQAEPAAQIGWADEFGNLFPMGAWKPAQRTHHDSHKAAWRPVFLHPPAAEVQTAPKVIRNDDGNYVIEGSPPAGPLLDALLAQCELKAEVQRLRDAAKRVTAAQSGSAFAINESINALRSALERGE